jgi:type II secretory pathway component PulM
VRFAERLNEWLAKMPSTNARIALTLICVLLTAVSYCIAWEAPETGWEAWLTFLAAMSGLDALQFGVKRKTDAGHVEAQAKVAEAKARATTMMTAVKDAS